MLRITCHCTKYFATLAKKDTAEAEDYTTMAKAYRAGARKGTYDAAVTFDRLARIARDAEKEAAEAAALQKQLASIG